MDERRGGWVYIMADRYRGAIYVGVTSNLAARIHRHKEGTGSAGDPHMRLRLKRQSSVCCSFTWIGRFARHLLRSRARRALKNAPTPETPARSSAPQISSSSGNITRSSPPTRVSP
ncbi:GIY-YIG nuclease family protein [Sphingosinicella sp. YJ22]|uniref:GIY-YIG nuclease family protein n=1 Tax=Sphingosinicella sp. YJ22 TaxID=1104780 RepID=UPI00140BE632